MKFWKRTPTITVAEHERIVADYEKRLKTVRDLVKYYKRDADELAADLAHWKAHGQLRDPATGRLIPKNAGKKPAGGE